MIWLLVEVLIILSLLGFIIWWLFAPQNKTKRLNPPDNERLESEAGDPEGGDISRKTDDSSS